MFLYNKQELKSLRRTLRKSSTPTERIIWGVIRNRQLLNLKFFRQYGIGVYIVDFYCPEIGLAIEIDGGQHSESKILARDEERTRYLQKLGVKILRFWNNEILGDKQGFFEAITACAQELLPTSSLEKRRNRSTVSK